LGFPGVDLGLHEGRWNAGEASKFAVPHRGAGVLNAVVYPEPYRYGKVPFLTFPTGSGTPSTPPRRCKLPGFIFHFRIFFASWGDLGAIFGALGPIFGALASILAALASILGAFRSILGDFGPIFTDFLSFFHGFRRPKMTKTLQNRPCLLNGMQSEKHEKT